MKLMAFGLRIKIDRRLEDGVYSTLIILLLATYNLWDLKIEEELYRLLFFVLFAIAPLYTDGFYRILLILAWLLNYFFVGAQLFGIVLLYFLISFGLRSLSYKVYQKDLVIAIGRGFISNFSRGKIQISWIDILYSAIIFVTIYIYFSWL